MNIIDLHQDVWAQLVARRSRLPHALLITGQRGIGKFELARRFAESLLCEQPTSGQEACGACIACGWLAQGNHPDFRLLQPEAMADEDDVTVEPGSGKKKPSQQIKIEQVRDLDDFLHVGTHRQGVRIVLIHPAEAMNRATANSLLKSLEEPIEGTLFILVSSEPARLLPTIRSRCQSIAVPQPAHANAVAWLAAAGVRDAEHWLALAGGSPLLAAELGRSDERELLDSLVSHLAQGSALDALAAAAAVDRVVKADKRPAPLRRLLEWSQKWMFDLSLVHAGLAPRYFRSEMPRLQNLVRESDGIGVLGFGRKALQYRAICEQPLNSRLFLEEFFLSYRALFHTPRGGNV
ncbi:DNA polymerase III subunit delta' [Propionivibrio limicola]|uniref:DNA polymerase III subunit delta' n=1 Tax=Propionivibrio limicola TaxID=167645 RepID=UPI0012914D38|nr:DNA polymerase III subunit delta' [Propionivibrio limicola]